jgi:hypothetical protein
MTGTHAVEVAGETATGVVYRREEVELPDTGTWRTGMIQYRDRYRRVDGRRLFERRQVGRW